MPSLKPFSLESTGDTHKPGAILASLKSFSLERFLLLRQIVGSASFEVEVVDEDGKSFAGVRLGFRFSGAMISDSLIQLCFNWSLFWPENRAFNFPAQFTM